MNETCTSNTFYSNHSTTKPQGYQQAHSVPVLRGRNYCHHCFCSPCVIALPPDFLRGSCSPHPANAEKRQTISHVLGITERSWIVER